MVAAIRQIRKREKAETILKGAMEEFLSKGYVGTSMDSIVASVGISKPTLYNHFKSKEILFEAILKRIVEQIFQGSNEKFFLKGPLAPALLEFAKRYSKVILQPELISLHRLIAGEAQRFPELGMLYYSSGYLKAEQGIENMLQHYVSTGDLIDEDRTVMSHQYWGLVLSYVHNYAICNLDNPLSQQAIENSITAGVKAFERLYAP